jgi:alpha-glucosidase
MIADLRRQGFRLVSIVDPHPKKQPGWEVYDSGLAGDHFVKNPDGSVFEGPVWPSNAERDPGPSVFPDFSKPAAREWWGGLYKSLTDVGIAGIWNDMNEPAAFLEPFHSIPQDLRHDGEGEPTDQREIHNVYGQLMTRSTYEGLLRLQPDKRPFVLTRASFAGGQRFAAAWPGDNSSDWSHLRASIPMLLGMGLSGFAFVGSDIGGFAGAPSPELVTRWLQLGVFYPFMRMHAELNSPDREPWSYGIAHEQLNRRAIELRYRLLPQLYGVMREASRTGLPAMRPLFLEFPDDPRTYNLNDQFLFGRDLLVAPVVREGAAARGVYLPAGDWYDFWTGKRHSGGREIQVPVTLETIPVFARAGAFVFQQPVVQHTGERAGLPLEVSVYPAAESTGLLYEDDGESRAYLEGAFLERRFLQRRSERGCRIEVGAAAGAFKPAPRELRIRLAWEGPLRGVRLGSEALRGFSEAELERQPTGFARSEGWAVVKLRDRPEAFQVALEP